MSASGGSLHIADDWVERLSEAGLADFDAVYGADAGEIASVHDRGWVRRVVLPSGRAVFIKVAAFTTVKQVLADVLRGRRPEPLTEKERRGLLRAASLGVTVPRPIAWGQRRRGRCRPWRGVLVTTELPGTPLSDYLASDPPGDERRAALRGLGEALHTLYAARLSWPDLRVKHVHVGLPGGVGLLDLERLGPVGRGHRAAVARERMRFGAELRAAGCDDDDARALDAGLQPERLWPGRRESHTMPRRRTRTERS